MYAVFRTGGKQYRAVPGEVIRVEKIDAEVGARVEIGEVLMLGSGEDVQIGAPFIEGGKVLATVRGHGRADKVMIIKFRRRKHYRKQQGHRQYYTEIEITDIGGESGSKAGSKSSAKSAASKTPADGTSGQGNGE